MDQQALGSRDIIGMIDNGLEMSKDKTWPFLCGMEFNSNQATEKYRIIGATPAMREWIGGRSIKSLRTAGVDVTNKPFEATMQIHVDDLRRDKTGFIKMRIDQMVEKAVSHWAKLLSTLRIAGTSTVCVDKEYFYAASHSWGDSGTLSNLLTSSDYSELEVTDADNPTPVELAKAILKVVQHFYTFKDDQGEPSNENASKFLVQVPINMYGALIQALSSNFLSTGTGVVDNPLKLKDGGFEIIPSPNPRLTSDVDFFVDRIDGAAKPFILQSETDIKISAKAEGSEFEHDTNMHEYGINVSRNVGFGFWDKSIKATLSQSG
jgi:phage major head subunit gpT-like protein